MTTKNSRGEIGLLDASMLVMGSMIGSGIFLAPSLIASIALENHLGAGSFVLIWGVGGLLTLCAAISFAELAASFPRTGGQYIFLSEAFSPFWGFLYGWTLFTVIQCGFIAAVAVAFANYSGIFVPWIGEATAVLDVGWFRVSSVQAVALGLVCVLTLINLLGLRAGATAQNILSIAKLGALAGLILFGLTSSKGDWSHFRPFSPQQLNLAVLTGFAVGLSKALFAFDSWNVVTFLSGETRDASRTLPRALIFGTLGVTAIYVLTSTTYLYLLPLPEAAAAPGQRIAAEAAQLILGPAGLALIALAVLISTAGCDNGLILSGPWLYHAMAKDGLFFKGAAELHPVRRVPVRSLLYQLVWASVLILSGSWGARGAQLYSDLLTFTSFASLLFNTLTVMGLFVLRKKQPLLQRPYRAFGYPLVPLIFIAVSTFFLAMIALGDPRNSGFGLGVVLCGIAPYYLWRRRATNVGIAAAAAGGSD